jgi:branched-subunit amino acid aminotransferase/4-amino-4-deoxychorismate lyase
MIVFLNGQFVPEQQALIPVSDRGFLYGDGLFETLRVCAGRPFRLAQHLERMMRGANFLKIKCSFTARELQEFAGQIIKRNQKTEAVLRITLTRGSGERGYTPPTGSQPSVVMMLHAAPGAPASGTACSDPSLSQAVPEAGAPSQWRLITSFYRIPACDPLSSFKTLNKLTHIMARMEAVKNGADEALLVNTNGEVAETAGGNLFWIGDGQICTVPTSCGALPGITRAVVLEICRTLGLPVNERVIKPQALRNSEGIFITQSVLGIVPVAAFDGKPVARSPLVEQISLAYGEMLYQPSTGNGG